MRINDVTHEYKMRVEQLKNIDEVIDSQEWLTDSCMQSGKEFKSIINSYRLMLLNLELSLKAAQRTIKTQMDHLENRAKEIKQNLKHEQELQLVYNKENIRQPMNYKMNDESNNSKHDIHSKEFTKSDYEYEYEYDSESINDPRI